MNKVSKIALFFGVLLLGLVMTGLVIYVEYDHSRALSQEASITAQSYSVGIDYSGLVSKQFVQEGDRVEAGQDLFYIQSNVLKQSMQELNLKEEDLLYKLNDKDEIVLTAAKNGVVSKIDYTQGSFVPANKEIAQIMSSDVVFADATFRMPERDFARIKKDTVMEVSLPNGTISKGKVSSIKVQSQKQSEVTSTVQAQLKDVDASSFISSTATPVQAKLILNPDSFYTKHIMPLFSGLFR